MEQSVEVQYDRWAGVDLSVEDRELRGIA